MAVPTLTSVTPSTGSYLGGTTVLVSGTGFTGVTAVTFAGVAADFEVFSATLLAATAPGHPAGAARLVVTNGDGPSISAVDFAFTVPAGPTITYTGDLETDLDRVRFYVGDTVQGSGPKPDDGNFTDEEIAGMVTVEGNWQQAVAAAFETLSSLWRKHTTFSAQGMQTNLSDVAKGFAEEAAKWREKRYASTEAASAGSGSVAITRGDGYSDDLDNVTRAADY